MNQTSIENEVIYQLKKCDLHITPSSHDCPKIECMALARRMNVSMLEMTAVTKGNSENSGLNENQTHDLCDTRRSQKGVRKRIGIASLSGMVCAASQSCTPAASILISHLNFGI